MKIKPELQDKYNHYVEINSEDEYSKAVIECGEHFGRFIDAGMTFDEAERGMLDTKDGMELTGYMMGAVMSAVVHFHPRGSEVKEWWNKRSSGTPDENGVKNPAILTLK